MCGVTSAAIQLGCPEASQDLAEPEAMLLVGTVIFLARRLAIMQKALEVRLGIYPLCFQAVVCFPARRSLYSSERPLGQSITTRSIFSLSRDQMLPAIPIEKDS